MSLEEINHFISILEKNKYFKKMLDSNNNELEKIYEIAIKYDESYLQNIGNIEGVGRTRVSCDNNQELAKIVKDFYVWLNIPDNILNKVQQNIIIDSNQERAKFSGGKIYLGTNDGTFEYVKTVIHEVAHSIRYYSQNNVVDTGLITEVESKAIENIFYKYLIKKDIKIIKDSNNGLRSLTDDDVRRQKLHEIEHEKTFIKRALEEYQLVKVLRENMNSHGSYQFTQDSLDKVISIYGLEKINRIKFLKDNYLSNNPFVYTDGYDVGNGRHLTNEFRFVYARLITEYLDNTTYQDNFGIYLLSSNITSTEDVMSYFKINSLDDLVSNQINKYNLNSQIRLTPKLEKIFSDIKIDSKYTSSELMKKYAGLPEYQPLVTKVLNQTKQLEGQVKQIRKNYSQMNDEVFFQSILSDYSKNIVELIKKEYEGKLTSEIIERLNKFSISVINDPEKHGDMTAHSDISQVSINMAHFATDTQNLESKIVRAMGTMPHELFHFVFKMLKDKKDVDEKMIYNLSNGDQAIVKGMVGHMLNEGFVEKQSSEFCQRNNIYYSPNPTYIQFTKLCDYIMKNNPTINEQFLINNNYDGVLKVFSSAAQEKYKETERLEYIENFKVQMQNGENRKIDEKEIVSSVNQHIESKKTPKEIDRPNSSYQVEKGFDQRSQSKIRIANQIKEKNMAIKQQKYQQRSLDKPKIKILTKPTNGGTNTSSSGYANVVTLALVVSFVAGALCMLTYYICK